MVLSLIGISAADYGPIVCCDANQDSQIDLNDVDYNLDEK
jgi:hypothetical protein